MTDTGKAKQAERRGPKKPRKATLKSLENAALYYLQRYSSSAENLRRVLLRRVERSAQAHDTDRAEGAEFVADIVSRYVASGLVDDRLYAEGKARSFHRRGLAPRAISQRLREKGVSAEDIEQAIGSLAADGENVELRAAVNLARRRRLGPYSLRGRTEERNSKDLAALARAGFSYSTAKTIIDAENPEDLEDLVLA